ncbi:MAG: hypothetical protein AAFU66_03905, partial [Pseudomonadota bacterium]
ARLEQVAAIGRIEKPTKRPLYSQLMTLTGRSDPNSQQQEIEGVRLVFRAFFMPRSFRNCHEGRGLEIRLKYR